MIRLKDGHIVDAVSGRDGPGDLWISDGRIVDPPADGRADATYELAGEIVMAGGIDIHSHIAGGNVNTARLLLPEQHKAHASRPATTPLAQLGFTCEATGCLYAQMGFTTVVEPAVMPSHALHAHLEMADIPIIDTAGLCVLGNDDYLLSLLHKKAGKQTVHDYVAHMVTSTRSLGVKVINAGAAAAFKANARHFSFDDIVPEYGVSSREIVLALQDAVEELGIAHPLHVHCNNLGAPGAADSAAVTMAAAEGRMHLAHLQFYGYGKEGKRGFSSAGARLADEVNRRPNITVDIGQVMFGQTVTVSCDVMRQFSARDQASPRKYVIFDGESSGGGIVPYHYKPKSFYNAVQWAVGLELFLLIADPWRCFFTTDHPNGAPFTTYPEIFALLMDADRRAQALAELPKSILDITTLASISREYSLSEIAIMTRAAPARLLGLADRGHLKPGAIADIAVYRPDADKAKMFRAASHVFKHGRLVVKDGKVVDMPVGRTIIAGSECDSKMTAQMDRYYEQSCGVTSAMFSVDEHLLGMPRQFETVPWAN